MMRSPDNALFHYLEAFEHLKKTQSRAALLSVRKGNRKTLRIPHTPMPERFSLMFPDDAACNDAGIAGKAVPPLILRLCALGNDAVVTAPLLGKFRNLARELAGRGAALKDEGRTDEALWHLESVATLGLKLVQRDSSDAILPLVGFAITGLASENLRSLYEVTDRHEKIKLLDAFDEARKTYVSEYSAFVKQSADLWTSQERLLKEVDRAAQHERRERAIVSELLKKTGLDSMSFEGRMHGDADSRPSEGPAADPRAMHHE